jgi:hypothetical protein
MYLLSFVAINYVYMILNCWVSLAHMFALVKTCRKNNCIYFRANIRCDVSTKNPRQMCRPVS